MPGIDAEIPAAVNAAAPAAPVEQGPSPEEAYARMGLDRNDLPSKPAEVKPEPTKEPPHLAAANGRIQGIKEPDDPLDEKDFSDEELKDPTKLRAAVERIQKARKQAAELTRASHRAHAAAVARERKLKDREGTLGERETRVTAIERSQAQALEHLRSGDPGRFLTGVQALTQAGDPAGFWKEVTIALAKGEAIPQRQQAQADANPELRQRLEMLEQRIAGGQAAQEQAAIEAAKDRNFEQAKSPEQANVTPRVAVYASDPRTAHLVRNDLAAIMTAEYRRLGRPIDAATACGILEENLRVHFELSQRGHGNTTAEKGTTGPGPEAGRAPSAATPTKPHEQSTIPPTLSAAPAQATRPLTPAEEREAAIQALEASGQFARWGLV